MVSGIKDQDGGACTMQGSASVQFLQSCSNFAAHLESVCLEHLCQNIIHQTETGYGSSTTVLLLIFDSSWRSPEHQRLCTLASQLEVLASSAEMVNIRRSGGLRAKLKVTPLPLPSIFLGNVRSLVNKMDEM